MLHIVSVAGVSTVLLSLLSRQGRVIGNAYGPGSGSIWLDDVVCDGDEESISDCSHQPWGALNCLHSEDVSIDCNEEEPTFGNITNSSSSSGSGGGDGSDNDGGGGGGSGGGSGGNCPVVVVVVVGLGSSSIRTSFYRAIAWTMLSQDVCIYVLSHVSILSKRLDISYFFHHRITTPFYIFSIPNVMQYSDRDLLTVVVKYRV